MESKPARVYRLPSSECIKLKKDPLGKIMWYHHNEDSKVTFLSGCHEGLLRIWQVSQEGGKCIHSHQAHRLPIRCLLRLRSTKENEQNLVATGSQDKLIKLFSLNEDDGSFRCVQILHGHQDGVKCLLDLSTSSSSQIRQKRLIASGSCDSSIKIWNLNLAGGVCIKTLLGKYTTRNRCIFSSNFIKTKLYPSPSFIFRVTC